MNQQSYNYEQQPHETVQSNEKITKKTPLQFYDIAFSGKVKVEDTFRTPNNEILYRLNKQGKDYGQISNALLSILRDETFNNSQSASKLSYLQLFTILKGDNPDNISSLLAKTGLNDTNKNFVQKYLLASPEDTQNYFKALKTYIEEGIFPEDVEKSNESDISKDDLENIEEF